jgi:hypothetical protein
MLCECVSAPSCAVSVALAVHAHTGKVVTCGLNVRAREQMCWWRTGHPDG